MAKKMNAKKRTKKSTTVGKQAPKIRGTRKNNIKHTHSYVDKNGTAYYRHAGSYNEILGDFPRGLLPKKELEKFAKGKGPVTDMGSTQKNLGASKKKTAGLEALRRVKDEIDW